MEDGGLQVDYQGLFGFCLFATFNLHLIMLTLLLDLHVIILSEYNAHGKITSFLFKVKKNVVLSTIVL